MKCIYFSSSCVQNWLISPSDRLFIKLLLSCCVEVLCPRPSPTCVTASPSCPESTLGNGAEEVVTRDHAAGLVNRPPVSNGHKLASYFYQFLKTRVL